MQAGAVVVVVGAAVVVVAGAVVVVVGATDVLVVTAVVVGVVLLTAVSVVGGVEVDESDAAVEVVVGSVPASVETVVADDACESVDELLEHEAANRATVSTKAATLSVLRPSTRAWLVTRRDLFKDLGSMT